MDAFFTRAHDQCCFGLPNQISHGRSSLQSSIACSFAKEIEMEAEIVLYDAFNGDYAVWRIVVLCDCETDCAL